MQHSLNGFSKLVFEIRFKQLLTLVLQLPLQKQNFLFVSEHVAILLISVWLKLGSSVCLQYGQWGHWICSDFSEEQTASNFFVAVDTEVIWRWGYVESIKHSLHSVTQKFRRLLCEQKLLQNPKKLTLKFSFFCIQYQICQNTRWMPECHGVVVIILDSYSWIYIMLRVSGAIPVHPSLARYALMTWRIAGYHFVFESFWHVR